MVIDLIGIRDYSSRHTIGSSVPGNYLDLGNPGDGDGLRGELRGLHFRPW